MKQNIVTIIISLCYMQMACKTVTYVSHTKIYERTSNDKVEKFKIDFGRQLFTYEASQDTHRYIANGPFTLNDEGYLLQFPAFSELEELSIFPKGYFELMNKDSSGIYQIDLTVLDLETMTDVKSHVAAFILGSFPISVEKTITNYVRHFKITTDRDSITMRIQQGRIIQDVTISERGIYQLNVVLPRMQTREGYETTTKGCFMILSNPTVTLNVCSVVAGEIRHLGLRDDCEAPFRLALKR